MMPVIDNLKYLFIGPWPHGPIGGFSLTLILFVLSGIGSMGMGLVFAALVMSRTSPVRKTAKVIVTLLRGLPSIVFLFWLYFLFPAMSGISLSPLASAVIALSIYHGAFISEDIRGGLQGVSAGQIEAGRATGLNGLQIFAYIRMPQALRATIPALVNRYITIFLYTSVASIVGVLEFTRATTLISNRLIAYPILLFGFAAFVYFVFSYGMVQFGRYLERRWNWAPTVTSGKTR